MFVLESFFAPRRIIPSDRVVLRRALSLLASLCALLQWRPYAPLSDP